MFMNKKIKEENLEFLVTAVLALDNKQECLNFFEDLCTIPELKAMSQRLQVAKMLSENIVYSEIVEKTGASTATISRVNRSLIYGTDGYATIFKKLNDNIEAENDAQAEVTSKGKAKATKEVD